MRGRGEALQLLRGDHLEPHLQLQGGQDRGQVGVPAALAVAVDAALHEAGAGFDRGERVGDRALGVVVGVDADLDRAVEGLDRGGRRLADEARQAAAICVAEGDVLGPCFGRGAHALEREGGGVAVAVEEVLGVEDDALAGADAEGDGVADHRQVLLLGDANHLLQVQAPALSDQADHRCHRLDQGRQGRVFGGGEPSPPGHPEGADRRALQLQPGEPLEELGFLRVGTGKASLDEVDAESVEGVDDVQLLADRERHALTAHAVPQGGVVEPDLFHLLPFASRRIGEGLLWRPGACGFAAPAARRLR